MALDFGQKIKYLEDNQLNNRRTLTDQKVSYHLEDPCPDDI